MNRPKPEEYKQKKEEVSRPTELNVDYGLVKVSKVVMRRSLKLIDLLGRYFLFQSLNNIINRRQTLGSRRSIGTTSLLYPWDEG